MILNVEFIEISQVIDVDFGEVQTVTKYVGGEPYDGDYIVTPKVTEQTLPTKDKILLDNVFIKSVPFYDVANSSGGSTVYIANEV